MSQNKIFLNDKFLGWLYQDTFERSKCLYFFGTQTTTFDDVNARFPNLKFYYAKQMHGEALVEAPFSNRPEADAVWSAEANVATAVLTADCLPLLIGHPHFSVAIHAGWRGVLNEISLKSLRRLIDKFGHAQSARVHIGPHIHASSFEVGNEVLQLFAKQLPYFANGNFTLPHLNKAQCYIDLKAIVMQQLKMVGLVEAQCSFLDIDTFKDSQLASYRRNKAAQARNLSFVARLSQDSVII